MEADAEGSQWWNAPDGLGSWSGRLCRDAEKRIGLVSSISAKAAIILWPLAVGRSSLRSNSTPPGFPGGCVHRHLRPGDWHRATDALRGINNDAESGLGRAMPKSA